MLDGIAQLALALRGHAVGAVRMAQRWSQAESGDNPRFTLNSGEAPAGENSAIRRVAGTTADRLVRDDPPPPWYTEIAPFLQRMVVSCRLPAGDMAGMEQVAFAFDRMAEVIEEVTEDARGHASKISTENTGADIDAFSRSFAALANAGGGHLSDSLAACEGLAAFCRHMATEIKSAKAQFYLSAAYLFGLWAVAKILAPTPGGPGARLTALTETRIAGLRLSMMLRTAEARAAMAGVTYAGGLNFVGQTTRIGYGLQDGLDSGAFLESVALGAVGGGMTGAMYRLLGNFAMWGSSLAALLTETTPGRLVTHTGVNAAVNVGTDIGGNALHNGGTVHWDEIRWGEDLLMAVGMGIHSEAMHSLSGSSTAEVPVISGRSREDTPPLRVVHAAHLPVDGSDGPAPPTELSGLDTLGPPAAPRGPTESVLPATDVRPAGHQDPGGGPVLTAHDQRGPARADAGEGRATARPEQGSGTARPLTGDLVPADRAAHLASTDLPAADRARQAGRPETEPRTREPQDPAPHGDRDPRAATEGEPPPRGEPGTGREPGSADPAARDVPKNEPAVRDVLRGEPGVRDMPKSEPGVRDVSRSEPGLRDMPTSEPAAPGPAARDLPAGRVTPSREPATGGDPSFNKVAQALGGTDAQAPHPSPRPGTDQTGHPATASPDGTATAARPETGPPTALTALQAARTAHPDGQRPEHAEPSPGGAHPADQVLAHARDHAEGHDPGRRTPRDGDGESRPHEDATPDPADVQPGPAAAHQADGPPWTTRSRPSGTTSGSGCGPRPSSARSRYSTRCSSSPCSARWRASSPPTRTHGCSRAGSRCSPGTRTAGRAPTSTLSGCTTRIPPRWPPTTRSPCGSTLATTCGSSTSPRSR